MRNAATSKHARHWLVLPLLMLPSVFVQAGSPLVGGTITFAPADAAAVPTLGGAALILLGVLLAVIAIRQARHGADSRLPLLAVGASGLALAAATSGMLLMNDVQANGGSQVISSPSRQTLDVLNTTNIYENAAGVPMSVVERDVAMCDARSDGCELGTVIEDGGSCELVCVID